ncbi:hypothetical protein [Larkinella soli]|uniref:hypothetical protein n=1 Tax=Larkinella soli TaxID=1770527 RepID=UPI000FFC1FB2|nr:hypothetical protein [Larkinella soli]
MLTEAHSDSSPNYPALKVTPKSGNEPFERNGQLLDATLLDFWRWSVSDLVSNATRGILAEFIVAKALNVANGVRTEWDAYDLKTPSGIKVEVKSAAYLQTWAHQKLSAIQFGIGPTKGWDAETNLYSPLTVRQADVYVFCLLFHQDKTTVNPLNIDQWAFYVLPTKVLNERCPTQKMISLNSLLRLNPVKADFEELAAVVEQVKKPLQ